MFKKLVMSAACAAAFSGVCAVANAQVLVEIEGPVSGYVADGGNAGTITVMNNKIAVTSDTAFLTPTQSRDVLFQEGARNSLDNRYNVTNWMRGDQFQGRRPRGLIGATVIVVGEVDPVTGIITAQEVFSDVAENVVLGAVSANRCTNAACDNPGDYIRGNGALGPVFVPNKDQRLPANPIVDAGLFELNLENVDLTAGATPTTFGGEGYFSQDPVHPTDSASPTEEAIVYWAFELGEIRPDLLLRPASREVSVLRVRCDVGDRLEVRGWVHQPVDANGNSTAGSAAQGTIRVTMNFPNAPSIVVQEADFVPEVNNAYARYQVRQDVADCAEEVLVEWLLNGVAQTSTIAPVDRLRGTDPADD